MAYRRDLVFGPPTTFGSFGPEVMIADTAFNSYAYTVGVSTALRTTSASSNGRFYDVINVKDFGAVGDGATDDTVAIQTAMYAAWGSSSNPNGGHGDVGSALYFNKALFFPNGYYVTSNELVPFGVFGSVMYGESPGGVRIENRSTNATAVIRTNGWSYSVMENLTLALPNSTGICLNVDYDGSSIVAAANSNNVQSNGFANIRTFGGEYGMTITPSIKAQGSEHVYLNCSFNNHTTAGWRAYHQNAVMHWFFDCDFHACINGIYCPGNNGDAPVVSGCTFSGSSQTFNGLSSDPYDINIQVSSPDTYFISGCHTTNINFVQVQGNGSVIANCIQAGSTSGIFAFVAGGNKTFPGISPTPGSMSLYNCIVGGGIVGSGANVNLRGNTSISPISSFISFGIVPMMLGVYHPHVPFTVATLPDPGFGGALRTYVTDATVSAAFSSNFASVVVGGGSNIAPVWGDTITWRIG